MNKIKLEDVEDPNAPAELLWKALDDGSFDIQNQALHALARLRGYSCETTRADDGSIGVAFPDHKGFSIKLLAYSAKNLAKQMETAIDLHQNSPFLNCRWDSEHGKVKQVELFSMPTLGAGSELYQITYDSGTFLRIAAKNMENFMKRQAYEITPEGQLAEKQAMEEAYRAGKVRAIGDC